MRPKICNHNNNKPKNQVKINTFLIQQIGRHKKMMKQT